MFSFKSIQSSTFIIVLVSIVCLFIWVISPYFYPIFWAAVIATLTRPLYKKILFGCKQRRTIATILTLLLIILLCLIPIILMLTLVIQQALAFYDGIKQAASLTTISTLLEKNIVLTWLQSIIGPIDIKEQLTNLGKTISYYAYQLLASGGQNTIRLIIDLFIMLYALFFFIRDGESILKKIMHITPLGDRYERRLYDRFVSTTRATLKGSLLIGLVQGTIGGIVFFIAGIPAAAFWGMVMIVSSIIPAAGAGLVLFIGAVIQVVLGNITGGIILFVGMIIVGSIDNVIRGPLVGKDTQMHPLLILFSTLGGLVSFGISGIVLGPVLAALTLSIVEIYQQIYKPELDQPD